MSRNLNDRGGFDLHIPSGYPKCAECIITDLGAGMQFSRCPSWQLNSSYKWYHTTRPEPEANINVLYLLFLSYLGA